MPVSLADGLVRSAAPALLGVAVATYLLLRARAEVVPAPPPEAQGRFFVLFSIPLTVVILGVVVAVQASASPHDLGPQLLAVGAAALVTALAQGVLGARRVAAVLGDASALGPAVLPLALAELPVLAALLWFFASAGAA